MRIVFLWLCWLPSALSAQVLFDSDSIQSVILKEKILQYGVKSISKSKVLYNGKKPGYPSLIVSEKYHNECDTISRFQNNKLQVHQVRCAWPATTSANAPAILSASTILADGRESMRVDSYLNDQAQKTAEYSIHFQQDSIRKEHFKYDAYNRPIWHYVQDRFEQHVFRWQYDTLGQDTLRIRYYMDGVLAETTDLTETFDAAGYYSMYIFVNGVMNRTTLWMLDGRLKTDILFNARGDTLTEKSTYSNSTGQPYMEVTRDFEFGTAFTLYTFYDKKDRVIGQLGVEGQNVEDPKLNWRLQYNRKGFEKRFNRLNAEGKVLYSELNKFDRNGFLLRKRYLNRDGKTYLEDRYEIKYR